MSTARPPLAALVFRVGKGCRQYPFSTADALSAWAARHPYKNEFLKVCTFTADGKFAEPKILPAAQAADHVRLVGVVI